MDDVAVLSLDGSTVRFSGSLDLDAPGATSFVVADFGVFRQEFGAGGLEFGEHVAEWHSVAFDEEYAFESGRLRLGSAEKYEDEIRLRTVLRLGLWQGKSSSVKTVIYNGSSAELLAVYDRVRIDETPMGPVLTPKTGQLIREGQGSPSVAKPVPGFGLIDAFRLTPSVARALPPWSGMQVGGGELFIQNPDDDRRALTLVGETSVARIMPDCALSDSALLAGAAELVVEWNDGPPR